MSSLRNRLLRSLPTLTSVRILTEAFSVEKINVRGLPVAGLPRQAGVHVRGSRFVAELVAGQGAERRPSSLGRHHRRRIFYLV